MSRKVIAGSLAVVLAVCGASIASAGDGGGKSRKVIRLTAKGVGLTFVDNGTPGLNRGDRFAGDGDLYRGAQKVGPSVNDCTIFRVEGAAALAQCTATASLPDGQITFQALGSGTFTGAPQTFTAAVTGGSGRYRTAHGEVTFNVAGSGVTGELIIRLR